MSVSLSMRWLLFCYVYILCYILVYVKIGSQTDNSSFRDLLNNEIRLTVKLIRQCMSLLRENHIKKHKEFELSFEHFRKLEENIDIKQKQVLSIVAENNHNTLLSHQIQEEEAKKGHAASFQSSSLQHVLEDGIKVEFLEYNIDEQEKRHREILEIERDVREVAEIYKDLASMVDEQQVNIDSIEKNITETHHKTESALKDLQSAEAYQRKARKRACCCGFLLLLIIGLIVLIVFGIQGKL